MDALEGAVDFGKQESRMNESDARVDAYAHYAELYLEQQELKARKKQLQQEIDDLDDAMKGTKEIIADDLKSENVKSKRMESGALYTLTKRRFYKASDPQKLTDWCIETGKKDMLSVHYGTLQSRMKELDIDPDEPIEDQAPSQVPDCVGFFEEESVRVSGIKKGKK